MIEMDAPSAADPAAEVVAASGRRGSGLVELTRNALRIRRTIVGLVLLLPMVFIALVGPLLAPHDARASTSVRRSRRRQVPTGWAPM